MTLARTVAEVLAEHVTLEVECIDRMYLNVYVPRLQYEQGVANFFIAHRGQRFASSALMDPITKAFVADIHRFAAEQGVDLISFVKGERKDDVAHEHLAVSDGTEGVLFVGRAQERTPVFRTEKRRNRVLPDPGPRPAPVGTGLLRKDVIRDNLDLGRPDQIGLVFDRRVTRRTPGRFRTRVITDGVVPSLHVDYKHAKIKQYHKLNQALRTETTINDTRDFGIGKRLENLPALREIGFRANRRLLDVQRTSSDCHIGEDAFNQICMPVVTGTQRAPALRFGDPRVMALLSVLVMFRLLPAGFSNRDLRQHLAALLGLPADTMTAGRMTYDLRRLRLHGLIERIPGTHRYQASDFGLRAAFFFTRAHARLLRPGLASAFDPWPDGTPLRQHLDRLDSAITQPTCNTRLAA